MRASPGPAAEFPEVLTAALAAEFLQVHVESLRKMVREGRVPCHRFPGGREMRFLRGELLEWLAALPADEHAPASVPVSVPVAAQGPVAGSVHVVAAHPHD